MKNRKYVGGWQPYYFHLEDGFLTHYDKKSLVGTKKRKVKYCLDNPKSATIYQRYAPASISTNLRALNKDAQPQIKQSHAQEKYYGHEVSAVGILPHLHLLKEGLARSRLVGDSFAEKKQQSSATITPRSLRR